MLGGAGHWTEQGASDPAAVIRRADMVARILAPYDVACAPAAGQLVLTGPSGRTRAVRHLGELWPVAERLAGRPIDPLDPDLLALLEDRPA
jgi:hypothetical protein